MTAPVFICGALRSGTTLLHIMLDHHAEIKNPGEFDFLFDKVSDSGEFPSTKEYEEQLSVDRIFRSKNLSIDSSLGYLQLMNSFITQLAQPNCLLALNIHRNFTRIPYLFPNAKFVHLMRDPRDVARSSIGMGWAGNVYYGVDHWVATEVSWQKIQPKLAPEQYIQIRFEELILSPKLVLQEVCNFFDVTYSDRMLNYSDNTTYSAPDPSLVYQWKSKLSIKEIQQVESKTHELMTTLGYELSGYPIITLGVRDRLALKISNKLFKWKFIINRYRVWLVVAQWLARLLRLESLNKQILLKISAIDKQYLK